MISIIVPVYNTEKYLSSCLDSLINQDVDKEIIIINDGSTDGSYQIIKKYQSQYSFIKSFSQNNKGQSSARNVGIKEARGDYVFFCDSDDYIENNILKRLEEICNDNNLDVLKTGWETIDSDGNSFLNIPNKHLKLNAVMSSKDYFMSSVKYWHNVIPWNGLIKRQYLIDNNIYFKEGIQFEDNYFHLLLMLSNPNAKIMQIDNCFYKCRITSNSTTTSLPVPKKVYDQLENARLMGEYVNNNVNDAALIKSSYKAISSLIFTMTSYYYRVDKKFRKEIYKTIPRKTLLQSIFYSMNLYQKSKIFIFAYFRYILDFIMFLRGK